MSRLASKNFWAIYAFALAAAAMLTLQYDLDYIPDYYKQARSANFSQTTGRILQNDRLVHRSGNPKYNHSFRVVRYGYAVGLTKYEGTVPRYIWGGFTEIELLGGLRAGGEVRVFYDPLNPSDSVLYSGINFWDKYYFLVLIFSNLVCVSAVIGVLYRMGRGQSDSAVPTPEI